MRRQDYPRARPYSRYARLYDSLGQSEFGLAVLPLVEQAMQRYRVPEGRALDLACGTGTVALTLAARGFRVTGVDRSPEMLEIAAAKAREAGLDVTFCLQDMARLRLRGCFDLVLCLYDSLNYLLHPRRLEAAFAAVGRVLSPGGLFVFDVNTPYCLANDWGNQVAEERCGSAVLLHLYRYDPGTGIATLELLCLHNTESGLEKFREIHRERGYTREEVAAALQRGGLQPLEACSFPDLRSPGETTSRLLCVATKPVPRAS